MIRKIILTGDEARAKLLDGVMKIENIVGATIGPKGRNTLIYRKYKSPLITNDGVTAARHTYLEDPTEDLGAQVLVETALKTNEAAGDGTSTATVIGANLFKEIVSRIGNSLSGSGSDPISLYKQAQKEKDLVVSRLKEMAKETSPEDLRNIIFTSLEDRDFAETIAKMLEEVGVDGHIDVRENWATKNEIESETILGMKFLGTYATPFQITELAKKEAVWEDVSILVTNEHIENIGALAKLIGEIRAQGKARLVIVSEKFEQSVIRDINNAVRRAAQLATQGKTRELENEFKVLLVKAPSLVTEELEDLAVFCDAKLIDKKAGLSVSKADFKDLGYIAKIVVDQDDVVVVGGRGNVEERQEILKAQLNEEKDTMFKDKLKKRIASLSSGVGIIRVGASTEQERTYLKYKIEDAVNAGRAALEEGHIPGGGLALKKISEELGLDSILYNPIRSPYERIQKNAGEPFNIPEEVIDPVKVTRLGLENAVSAAGILATTETTITEKQDTILDLLAKQIKGGEEDDFREYSEYRGAKIED